MYDVLLFLCNVVIRFENRLKPSMPGPLKGFSSANRCVYVCVYVFFLRMCVFVYV